MIREAFVGRERELELLRNSLLGEKSTAVVISGIGGIGKTALGYVFSEMHERNFPGGISRLHANSMESLEHLTASTFIAPNKCSLVIIDDVDQRPHQTVGKELAKARKLLPKARFILTTRTDPTLLGAEKIIELSGLSREQMRSLIEHRAALADKASIPEGLIDLLEGHTLAGQIAAATIKAGKLTPRQVLERLHNFTASGLYDAYGSPLQAGETQKHIISDVTTVSDEFLKKLCDKPDLLYELSPRGFEEVVAEILHKLGYDITLTPASKDGGKDIYAARKSSLGSFLYIVECKRYAPDNTVGVGLIRQLNGVVEAERATAGILATTSFFSKDAKEFQTTIANRMSLKDYLGIQGWLAQLTASNA